MFYFKRYPVELLSLPLPRLLGGHEGSEKARECDLSTLEPPNTALRLPVYRLPLNTAAHFQVK